MALRDTANASLCLMQRYAQLLFEHPSLDQRGQLWLGHWPLSLRQDFTLLLERLSLREGQATLARIGRRAIEVFQDLWNTYREAIALTQPPPSEPDFYLDTSLHPATPPAHLSPPPPPWQLALATLGSPRIALHTPPLCSGGHITWMPVLASSQSKGSYPWYVLPGFTSRHAILFCLDWLLFCMVCRLL